MTICKTSPQGLKCKAEASLSSARSCKNLDFLNQKAIVLNPLPFAAVADIEATFQPHRKLLRSNSSVAKGSGQIATTFAHFNNVLRGSRQRFLIICKSSHIYNVVVNFFFFECDYLFQEYQKINIT